MGRSPALLPRFKNGKPELAGLPNPPKERRIIT